MKTSTFTVAEIAERFGVSVETVAGWIRAGELKAVNVSRSRTSKKPRWRISQAALDAFETSRSATVAPEPKRARRKKPADVIEFYR